MYWRRAMLQFNLSEWTQLSFWTGILRISYVNLYCILTGSSEWSVHDYRAARRVLPGSNSPIFIDLQESVQVSQQCANNGQCLNGICQNGNGNNGQCKSYQVRVLLSLLFCSRQWLGEKLKSMVPSVCFYYVIIHRRFRSLVNASTQSPLDSNVQHNNSVLVSDLLSTRDQRSFLDNANCLSNRCQCNSGFTFNGQACLSAGIFPTCTGLTVWINFIPFDLWSFLSSVPLMVNVSNWWLWINSVVPLRLGILLILPWYYHLSANTKYS